MKLQYIKEDDLIAIKANLKTLAAKFEGTNDWIPQFLCHRLTHFSQNTKM